MWGSYVCQYCAYDIFDGRECMRWICVGGCDGIVIFVALSQSVALDVLAVYCVLNLSPFPLNSILNQNVVWWFVSIESKIGLFDGWGTNVNLNFVPQLWYQEHCEKSKSLY